MKNVAQEVQAKIIELGQAGKKPGLIAVMTKVKKDDIIEILKAAGIEVEGTPVQDTKAPDAAVVGADAAAPVVEGDADAAAPVVEGDAANAAPVEGDETQNKLAQMMNQVQEEKAAAPAKAKKEKAAKEPKAPRTTKKDKSMSDNQRKVIAIISDSAKLVYLTTRPSYGSLATAELMAERAKRRLGVNKPKLVPLATAEDLRVVILAIAESTDQAEELKAEQHEIFAKDYTMLSTSPKGSKAAAPAPAAAPEAPAGAVEETKAEEPVVETADQVEVAETASTEEEQQPA